MQLIKSPSSQCKEHVKIHVYEITSFDICHTGLLNICPKRVQPSTVQHILWLHSEVSSSLFKPFMKLVCGFLSSVSKV